MLTQAELATLHSIVSDDTKTFESIAQSFQDAFEKFEQFKVGKIHIGSSSKNCVLELG